MLRGRSNSHFIRPAIWTQYDLLCKTISLARSVIKKQPSSPLVLWELSFQQGSTPDYWLLSFSCNLRDSTAPYRLLSIAGNPCVSTHFDCYLLQVTHELVHLFIDSYSLQVTLEMVHLFIDYYHLQVNLNWVSTPIYRRLSFKINPRSSILPYWLLQILGNPRDSSLFYRFLLFTDNSWDSTPP